MWWVGGYGPELLGVGTGIGVMHERDDGSLEYAGVAVETSSPSWLAEHAGHLYSADEASQAVSSFRRVGSALVHDGTASSAGDLPCHLTLLDNALVAANYDTGTIGVVGLTSKGAVGELLETLPTPVEGGHAHSSLLLGDGTLLSADLGADRVLVHTVDGQQVTRTGEVAVTAGTGPRDLALHASGLVYLLGQLGGSLTVFEWGGGVLSAVSSVDLPGALPTDDAAAIAFGPGGYVYAGVRGTNRISVLHSSADGRTVEPVGWVSCEGDWPRHLTVDGDVLHVANQMSSTVASFSLGSDGIPSLIREPENVPSPTFLLKAL